MSATDVLKGVWLFSGLEPAQLEAISNFTFQKKFAPGEVIVEEGRTGNGMYMILSGEVDVIKGIDTDNPNVLARLGPGEVFGEMALLGEWPRTASVVASEEVECLGIDRWVFLTQLERHPHLVVNLLLILAKRLRDTDARLVG
jgi:CRP/FNR family cyclic AMP-dependent transcriptional regulator